MHNNFSRFVHIPANKAAQNVQKKPTTQCVLDQKYVFKNIK